MDFVAPTQSFAVLFLTFNVLVNKHSAFLAIGFLTVSDLDDGGLKDARDKDNNIIIGDSTFFSLLPPQLKQISERYKVMCGCKCFISTKIIHSSLLSWHDRYFKNLNIKAKMLKTDVLLKKHTTYMKHIEIH